MRSYMVLHVVLSEEIRLLNPGILVPPAPPVVACHFLSLHTHPAIQPPRSIFTPRTVSMLQLFLGPYRPVNRRRLPVFPPIGLTGLTGQMGASTISGPSEAGQTTVKLIHTRDPVLPLFAEVPSSAFPLQVYQVSYHFAPTQPSAGNATPVLGGPVTEINRIVNGQSSAVNVQVNGAAESIYSPMGDTWAPMLQDETLPGIPFLYVPLGYALVATASLINVSTSGAIFMQLEWEYWTLAGQIDAITTTAPGGPFVSNVAAGFLTVFANAPAGVWIRPTRVSLEFPNGTGSSAPLGLGDLTFTVMSGAASFVAASWPLQITFGAAPATQLIAMPFCLPSAHNTTTPIMLSELLPHSSRLALENVTQVMSKEGTVQGARFNLTTQNPWTSFSGAAYNRQDPRKRYIGGAEHGILSYVEPGSHFSATRSHRFLYYRDGTSTSYCPTASFRPGDAVNVISIYDPSPATPGQFLATLWTEWEYITPFATLPLAVASGLTTEVEKALQQLATQCPFGRFERNGSVLATTRGASVRPSTRSVRSQRSSRRSVGSSRSTSAASRRRSGQKAVAWLSKSALKRHNRRTGGSTRGTSAPRSTISGSKRTSRSTRAR